MRGEAVRRTRKMALFCAAGMFATMPARSADWALLGSWCAGDAATRLTINDKGVYAGNASCAWVGNERPDRVIDSWIVCSARFGPLVRTKKRTVYFRAERVGPYSAKIKIGDSEPATYRKC